MKNDCSVVKDLIPMYAEGLVSPETKEFINEHCRDCENCRKLLENLAKYPDEKEPTDSKKEKVWTEIASKERKKKKWNLFFYILPVIIAILVVAGYIFLKKPIQDMYYKNYVTQYDLTCTELTFEKTGFTEKDIEDAAEVVKKKYEGNPDVFKLLRLEYSERETTDENKAVTNPNHADAIFFRGEYYRYVESRAGDTRNLIDNWVWVVKKDSNGVWRIIGEGH